MDRCSEERLQTVVRLLVGDLGEHHATLLDGSRHHTDASRPHRHRVASVLFRTTNGSAAPAMRSRHTGPRLRRRPTQAEAAAELTPVRLVIWTFTDVPRYSTRRG